MFEKTAAIVTGSVYDGPMDSTSPALTDILSYDYLAWVSDDGSFERALDIHDITIVSQSDRVVEADVQGTADEPYRVTLTAYGDIVLPTCTCPVEWNWCKHAIAVGLALSPEDGNAGEGPWGLDCAAVEERFFDQAPRETLVQVLRDYPVENHADPHPLLTPAVLTVGTPQEVAALMRMAMKSLAETARHRVVTIKKSKSTYGYTDDLMDIRDDFEGTIETLNSLEEAGRGKYLLPVIEKLIESLLLLCEPDLRICDFISLLLKALALHLRHCQGVDAGSTHLVTWLARTIPSILEHLPFHDFTPYAVLTERKDLVAAADAAEARGDSLVHAHLCLLLGKDALLIAHLAAEEEWLLLVRYYTDRDRLDEARAVIRNAWDPDSPAWIDDDDLGILIRTYLPMEDYLHWLKERAKTSYWGYAIEYVQHPLVSYDDAMALIEVMKHHKPGIPYAYDTRATLRFLTAAHHKRIDEALQLFYTWGPLIQPDYIADFAIDQLPKTHPLTCVEMVRDCADRLVWQEKYAAAATYLVTLQRVIAASPEASRAARDAVIAIIKEHPGDQDLRCEFNCKNLITSLDT
ncbi:hypothetical protein I6I68_03790 [Corynebacterium glucuronolyticum]|nr:hypothetical protein I6I68_03790 [Corynebacterium glucuronolyticum]